MKRDIPKGVLHHHVDLRPFTSWHIGGCADRLYWPRDLDGLRAFLKQLDQKIPVTYLGLGSNVLISDEGIKGVVIITQGSLSTLSVDGDRVTAGAGLSCAKVARFAAHNNLVGGEFLAGIPGTIGGALRMNAGAFGGETWPKVEGVMLINRQGELLQRKPDAFRVGYRKLKGLKEDEWFVSANFIFSGGDGKRSLQSIKALLTKRSATQPTGEPSCGSVFKNPPGKFSAQLIDSLGLKGKTVGGAQISEKHANFIINQGCATAHDVLALIHFVRAKVKARYNILLELEVMILGGGKDNAICNQ